MGEEFLEERGEHDGDGEELGADCGPETPVFGATGEDPVAYAGEVFGPGGPFGVFFGVAGEVEAEDEEEPGEEAGCGVAFLGDGGGEFRGEFGEESA